MTWTTLLWCRLLSSSNSCLKEMWRLAKEKRRENRKYIRPVHGWQRSGGGCMHITPDSMEGLRVEDPQSFFNYLRMEPAMFDELVQRLGPRIEKQDTSMRKALRFPLEWDRNVSNAVEMLFDYLECSTSVVWMHFERRSIFFYFECTSKVLNMSKTFRLEEEWARISRNADQIPSECLGCTSIVEESTTNFHSNGIPAHSDSGVTRV